MSTFDAYLKQLNTAQRQAVQTIDGPVLVVAGPGTGKTQLLSLRAANIVAQTDVQPSNILCLTFTESAASNMRERLARVMGPDGNKVAVHTFHSFGSDIINHYSDHFYNGARFTPADELASYEILQDIFSALPHNNPLAKTMNGEFTYLRDAQRAISHLKRAGLVPAELLSIISHNDAFCDHIESQLASAFAARLSKKDVPHLAELADKIATYAAPPLEISFVKPLQAVCAQEFALAVEQAQASGKTTALTAWRNRWCEKNAAGDLVLKDRARSKKLRALSHIYEQYRAKLQADGLFDFDDMISTVAHTVESTPVLKFALQEQYQYIMVDEFQDTNGAQARLLTALGDNPVNEGRPNILAVGDDDQAIYSFQGAELSNILDFAARYRDVTVITLTENYRSTAQILRHARQVITLGQSRLETTLQHINKELEAHATGSSTVALDQFASPQSQYQWIADDIAKRHVPLQDIAVIARTHRELIALLPYLHAVDVPVNYERRNNVLDSPFIQELLTLADVVNSLSAQRFDAAEELLPELLSYPCWGLKPTELWQLSLRAYKENRMWLELMLEHEGRMRQIAEFLIVTAHQALHDPLDTMLDVLLGTKEMQADDDGASEAHDAAALEHHEDFVSPLRDYYFNQQRLHDAPAEYMQLLSSLGALRQALRTYRPDSPLRLNDLLEFENICEQTGTTIVDNSRHSEAAQGVALLTAHKAKGLEFETVYVLSCQDDVWGRRARRPAARLNFPYNLPIEPAGASYDDALRLFFVAITRAKRHLHLGYYSANADGKPGLRAEFLQSDDLQPVVHEYQAPALEQATPGWQERYIHLPKVSQKTLLQPTLDSYKLSATHLNNFIDVSRGGPQAFLLQNLLRFPQAMTPAQAFGHAIHAVLQRAHTHLSATGEQRPLEDVLHDFELQLQQSRLGERDLAFQLEKGSTVLQAYMAARAHTFTPAQKAERNFSNQGVVVNGVRLTGAIDLMEIDPQAKTITVIDYKTGKGTSSWQGKTDFEKIKLHKYKQQLMLYKLLVEHSRDFTGYTVTKGILDFVEPDADGELHQLELSCNAEDMAAFTTLLQAVWGNITTLDLPDISAYPANYKGVQDFEHDLTLRLDKKLALQ